jgi:hypothetical protein
MFNLLREPFLRTVLQLNLSDSPPKGFLTFNSMTQCFLLSVLEVFSEDPTPSILIIVLTNQCPKAQVSLSQKDIESRLSTSPNR